MIRLRSVASGAFLAGLMISSTSCGGSGPKLHPVRGKVMFENAPAAGASVVLHPVASEMAGLKPAGMATADGSFTLTTYPHGEGAPEGEYIVVVTWYPENAREQESPKNKLPAKYADPSRTSLPRVTIKSGPNELEPFNLSRK